MNTGSEGNACNSKTIVLIDLIFCNTYNIIACVGYSVLVEHLAAM